MGGTRGAAETPPARGVRPADVRTAARAADGDEDQGVRRAAGSSELRGRKELLANPCDHVEFTTPRKRRRVRIAWTLEHVRQFCRAVEDHQLGPLFLLAALVGLRRGELCGLRWSDVNLDEGYLTVNTQLYTVGYQVAEGPPKSDSGDDEPIALDAATVEMLRRVRARQREQRLAWGEGWVDSGRVFTRENGAWHPDRVYKVHAALLRQLGLPHVRLHDLRHISVMLGAEAGETIEQASRRLRHSSITVTSDFYGTSVRTATGEPPRPGARSFSAQERIPSNCPSIQAPEDRKAQAGDRGYRP